MKQSQRVVPAPIVMQRSSAATLKADRVIRWGAPLPAALCCWDYATGEWQGCCTSQCLCTAANAIDPFESALHTAAYLAEHPNNEARITSCLGACIATLGRGAASGMLRRGVVHQLVDSRHRAEPPWLSYYYGGCCSPCSAIQATSVLKHLYTQRRHPGTPKRNGTLSCCAVDGISFGPLQDFYFSFQTQRIPLWRCCQCCCCPTAHFVAT